MGHPRGLTRPWLAEVLEKGRWRFIASFADGADALERAECCLEHAAYRYDAARARNSRTGEIVNAGPDQ